MDKPNPDKSSNKSKADPLPLFKNIYFGRQTCTTVITMVQCNQSTLMGHFQPTSGIYLFVPWIEWNWIIVLYWWLTKWSS